MLKNNNIIKTREELQNEGTHLTIMEYNSLISAIPKTWLKCLKGYSGNFCPIEDGVIKVNNKHKHISLIKSKEFYNDLINRNYTTPTAISKWEDIYFYVNFDWSHIFKLPSISVRETVIQSLQYQILNRYFPCKETLSVWYNNNNNLCDFCLQIDTLEHYFF